MLTGDYLRQCGGSWGEMPKPWSGTGVLQPRQQPLEGHPELSEDATRVEEGDWALVNAQSLDLREILKLTPPLRALYVGETPTEAMKKCLELLLPQPYAKQAMQRQDLGYGGSVKWVAADEHSESQKKLELKIWETLPKHVRSLTQGEPIQWPDYESRLAPGGSSRRPGDHRTPSSDYLLKDGVYTKLMTANAALVQTDGRVDPIKEAYFCRCLAATLASLSGKHHFGTEASSPESVRYLALALLNKAEQLSASAQTWKDLEAEKVLVGTGVFECTQSLFEDTQKCLYASATENPALREIYRALIPPAW